MLILAAVMDVDLDSVPGHCSLMRLGSVNKQVFGASSEGFSIDNLRIIRHEVLERYNKVCAGKPVSDPLKVFIKQEPHKQAKLQDGRLRLIMSVSLIDALVDRILFMRLAHRVIKHFSKTHILIGWSPVNGGYRMIDALFGGNPSVSIDKKAWDWSVPIWLLYSVRDVILELSSDAPEWWKTAVIARFECLFVRPEFVFPDGTFGFQDKPGVMKSGCYLTILINSIAQLILHEMAVDHLNLGVTAEPIVVLGDDSLQRDFPRLEEYVKYIRSLGFNLEVERHTERCEFAGFTYRGDYRPAYKNKHLFMLEHLPTTERIIASQTLQNYQILYYFDEEMRKRLRTLIRTLDMPEAVVSETRLRAIALG